MPPFLSVIRSCDKSMREYLFRELSQIISIIKLHARNYMKDIFAIIKVCLCTKVVSIGCVWCAWGCVLLVVVLCA